MVRLLDPDGLSAVAHEAGIPLVVDSTPATPYLVRPIEHGADIVIHSATKFIGGHGTTLGGVVVESGTFNWGNGNSPSMTEPVESYGGIRWWDNFGEYGFLTSCAASSCAILARRSARSRHSTCCRASRRSLNASTRTWPTLGS